MDHALWLTTVVDVGAVLALAWLVWAGARDRARNALEQRDALERLRGDLGHLLEDAEARARRLENALGGREQSLRALLGELERVAPQLVRSRRAVAPTRPLVRSPGGDAPAEPVRLEPEDEVEVDPAELRLRREIELALGRTRLA